MKDSCSELEDDFPLWDFSGGKFSGVAWLKVVSDMIRAIQTNLSREKPLFTKLSEKFDDSVSSLRSSSCFENQILSYPICTQFVKATMLPAWRRIALKSLYLRMSSLQSLLPLRLEYWYGISFPDQIPPVNTLLKITPTLYWVICLNENLWRRLN